MIYCVLPQICDIKINDSLVSMTKGNNFALKELADVEGNGEDDEWTDITDESVLVRGRVLLPPVIVEGVVDCHVPFHCYTWTWTGDVSGFISMNCNWQCKVVSYPWQKLFKFKFNRYRYYMETETFSLSK